MKTLKTTAITALMFAAFVAMVSMTSCKNDTDIPKPNPDNGSTINVKTPGTLWQELRKAGIKDSLAVTSLSVSGTLNSADIICLRAMAGGGKTLDEEVKGQLSNLDMTHVRFEKDPTAYFTDAENNFKFSIPTVDSLPGGIFIYTTQLKTITLPESVNSIGDKAFGSCPALTDVTVPNNVKSIAAFAFAACRSLTAITIPESVSSIGNKAFADCTKLSSITIKVTDLSKITFADNLFGTKFSDNITLYVPANLVDAYKKIPQFKDVFGDRIQPIQ